MISATKLKRRRTKIEHSVKPPKPISLVAIVADLRLARQRGFLCVPRKTIERLIAVCEAAITLYDGAGDADAEKDALGALIVAVRGGPYRPTKPRTTKPNRKRST